MGILQNLANKWIVTEISHRVSKTASNQFWSLANEMFHDMYEAKGNHGRKIPQFDQLRKKLYASNVPEIKLEIGYESKLNGEVTVVEAHSTPVSAFPPSTHRRLYEIASVDVSIIK